MLVELLRHALLPCPRWQKRLGILHGLIALDHRAQRQKAAWAPHQHACQTAFLEWLPPCPSDQQPTVVVLGSGLLLEVPLQLLAERSRAVFCYDLYHLPRVFRHHRRLSPELREKCHFLSWDLTGVLETIDHTVGRGQLPQPQAALPDLCQSADWVISCNCLSQLASFPLAYADACGQFRPDQLARWGRGFVTDHLHALQTLPASVRIGLLFDSRRSLRHPDHGTETDWMDLLRGAPLPPLRQSRTWEWHLAPAGEEIRGRDIIHQMHAGELCREDSAKDP